MCLCAHEATVLSPQMCHKILNAKFYMDYSQKCCVLKLLPLDKLLLLNKCVLMQKAVYGKAPQYLKDLMIPFERLHVHGNKQLFPRTMIDIFKTSFSFSGSLAWNSLPHHLRYPMEVKIFKRKHFMHSLNHIDTCSFIRQTTWHKMYCIFPLAWSSFTFVFHTKISF